MRAARRRSESQDIALPTISTYGDQAMGAGADLTSPWPVALRFKNVAGNLITRKSKSISHSRNSCALTIRSLHSYVYIAEERSMNQSCIKFFAAALFAASAF